MLTEEQRQERLKVIGGSDARKILSGDWLELYEEKKGIREPEFTKDQMFLMDMGSAVEPVIRTRWFDEFTAENDYKHMHMMENPYKPHDWIEYLGCNLDSMLNLHEDSGKVTNIIQEIKFHTGMKDIEELAEYYYGQIQHNIECAGVQLCHFTVGFGAWGKYANLIVERDDAFIEQYLELCQQFWWHVENSEPPSGEFQTENVPEAPAWTKVIDMTGNNSWADATFDYAQNMDSAKRFEECKKLIKELMPDDAGVAYGHGIKAKRDKRGAVRITKLSERDKLKFDKQKEKAA